MHTLIAKYVNAFQTEKGTATEKVKKVLMRHSHAWDWASSDGLIADLIDDVNITAQDIVDFLSDTYEIEGGSEEFHYAIRALQICLRKAELANMTQHDVGEEFIVEDSAEEDNSFYFSRGSDILQTMQY